MLLRRTARKRLDDWIMLLPRRFLVKKDEDAMNVVISNILYFIALSSIYYVRKD